MQTAGCPVTKIFQIKWDSSKLIHFREATYEGSAKIISLYVVILIFS